MIKIKEKNTEEVCTPHYLLKYDYMIGNGHGQTSFEVEISENNPNIERFVTLLNSLKPLKGHWGIVLEEHYMKDYVLEGQISEDDSEFLCNLMFEESFEDDFSYGIRSEGEYYFLIFEGIEIFYIDKYGESFETEIV